ncbi:hypothetical protein QHF83_51255, partial [Polyangium sp. 15x6]|nr:hypothetical protein [Polyangium sp. 15x6]
GGSGGAGGSGGSGGAGGSAPFAGVILELTDRYVTETGEVTKNRDIAVYASIEAQVVADDGTVTTFPGSLSMDGSRFEIPGVPEGPYWVVLTSSPPANAVNTPPARALYRIQEARTVDLGRIFAGRPDVASATQPVDVTLDADGLAPWQQYSNGEEGNPVQERQDTIEFYSFNADALAELSPSEGMPGLPQHGATSINGLVFSWLETSYPAARDGGPVHLVDGTKGDVLHATHLVDHQVTDPVDPSGPWGSFTYKAAEASFSTSSVTMTNGQPASISGTFVPLALKSFELDFKGSLFTSEIETNGPGGATAASMFANVLQEPGAPNPMYGNPPTLLSFLATGVQAPVDPACFPDDTGMCDPACAGACNAETKLVYPGDYQRSFAYGNPYGAHGTERFSFYVQFRMRPTHPVEMTLERVDGRLSLSGPSVDLSGKPITPPLGLPRNVKLDDKTIPVDGATTGVGSAPVVTFEAPAFGSPSFYNVSVIQLDDVRNANGNVLRQNYTVLSASTTETSFRIPEGVLQSGRYYYLSVSASSGYPPPESPYKYASATVAAGRTYTGMFTP